MNILIVGGDTKGAWTMRGVQLGRAIGARATPAPSANDWAWADLVVLVKRAAMQWHRQASSFRGPVVWDALDFWEQPIENGLTCDEAASRAQVTATMAGATTLIGATRAMADDLGGPYLTHHCRLGLKPTPPRKAPLMVGYDGQKKYLGRWLTALESSCSALGLTFVVNPVKLSDADVLVSFRDGRWDGEVCRRWKSGVKQVNAIVAGRPMLSQPSAAHDELLPVGTAIQSPDELTEALSVVTRRDVREEAYARGLTLAPEFQVSAVAAQYQALLNRVISRAA